MTQREQEIVIRFIKFAAQWVLFGFGAIVLLVIGAVLGVGQEIADWRERRRIAKVPVELAPVEPVSAGIAATIQLGAGR